MAPTSSDERRDLYEIEFPSGESSLKIVVAKKDCRLGNHYHKLKDEEFTLFAGTADMLIGASGLHTWSGSEWLGMPLMQRIFVPRGTYHSFELSAGSILLGYCSKSYDPTDDYKV